MNALSPERLGRLARRSLLLLLVLLAAASAIQAARNGVLVGRDLQWHEGALIASGVNPYERSVAADQALGTTYNPITAVQLPSVLLLFAPLGALEHEQAKLAWVVLNYAVTPLLAFLVLAQFRPGKPRLREVLFASLLLVASAPWRETIGIGQHGIVGLTFFMLGYRSFSMGRTLAPIAFLSLAMIKYTLVLPLFALLLPDLRRATVVVLGVAGVHAMLTVLVGFLVGENPASLVWRSLELADRVTALGWVDVFAVHDSIAPGSGTLLLPAVVSAGMAFGSVLLCLRRVDSRVASVVGIVALTMMYHRAYDGIVLIFLVVHLMNLVAPPGRPPQWAAWRGAEVLWGAAVIGYAFFVKKAVYVLEDVAMLSPETVQGIDLVFAACLYGYLIFLAARAGRARAVRTA